MQKAWSVALMFVASAMFVTSLLEQVSRGKPAAAATQNTHPTPEKKPVVERHATDKTKSKGKVHHYTGNVTKVDTMMKTVIVKGKKDELTFNVSKAQFKGDVKEGDKVTVTYAKKDGTMSASSVVKAGSEKEMQKQIKPGAKPIKQASEKK